MKANTIIFAFLTAIIMIVIGAIFGVQYAVYTIAAYYLVKGIVMKAYPDKYDKFSAMVNPTKKEALNYKSIEFKQHIAQEPIGNMLIGVIMIYFGFRVGAAHMIGIKYLAALAAFILIYIFGETYAMVKSNTYVQYRRINNYIGILLLIVALLFI